MERQDARGDLLDRLARVPDVGIRPVHLRIARHRSRACLSTSGSGLPLLERRERSPARPFAEIQYRLRSTSVSRTLANEPEATPALGKAEAGRVQHPPGENEPELGHGVVESPEVASPVGAEQPRDVLKKEPPGLDCFDHAQHVKCQVAPWVCKTQSPAGDRVGLARRPAHDKIDVTPYFVPREIGNVADPRHVGPTVAQDSVRCRVDLAERNRHCAGTQSLERRRRGLQAGEKRQVAETPAIVHTGKLPVPLQSLHPGDDALRGSIPLSRAENPGCTTKLSDLFALQQQAKLGHPGFDIPSAVFEVLVPMEMESQGLGGLLLCPAQPLAPSK